MKKIWSVAAIVALVLGISAATLVSAETPASEKAVATAEAAQDNVPIVPAELPLEIPEALEDIDLFDGQSDVVFTADGCTARKTCPDGCVIACGGNSTCSVGSFSVTCDGNTYTCSGPRLCPF